MVKSVSIDKTGRTKLEITMDYIVYQAARGLLASEIDIITKSSLGYQFENYITGEGFEIFLKSGIAHFIKNKESLEAELDKAKLTILDEYPQIAKKEIEKIKNHADNVEGRPSNSDRDKIRIITEMICKIGEEYGGRIPKNILIA